MLAMPGRFYSELWNYTPGNLDYLYADLLKRLESCNFVLQYTIIYTMK